MIARVGTIVPKHDRECMGLIVRVGTIIPKHDHECMGLLYLIVCFRHLLNFIVFFCCLT
jgi:hypothetical protein